MYSVCTNGIVDVQSNYVQSIYRYVVTAYSYTTYYAPSNPEVILPDDTQYIYKTFRIVCSRNWVIFKTVNQVFLLLSNIFIT